MIMLSKPMLRWTLQNLFMMKIVKELVRFRQVNQGIRLLSDIPPLFYILKMTLKGNWEICILLESCKLYILVELQYAINITFNANDNRNGHFTHTLSLIPPWVSLWMQTLWDMVTLHPCWAPIPPWMSLLIQILWDTVTLHSCWAPIPPWTSL